MPMQTPSVNQPKLPVVAEAVKLSPHEEELRRKEALLGKVKLIRERLAQNQGWVEGMKPDKVYVWVHMSDNRQIHFQSMGYELCKDPAVQSKWKRADGTHTRGDVILYECDKDLHEAISMEAELRAVEAVEGAKEGFRSVAARAGVPVFEPRG